MNKITLKESDLKSLIKKVINESEEFKLSTNGRLEFLLTSLGDLANEIGSESNGDLVYYHNRLVSILRAAGGKVNEAKGNGKFDKVMNEFGRGKLKTSAGDKVTNQKQAVAIAYSESGLDEKDKLEESIRKIVKGVLLEWKPNSGYNEWANIESGGSHGRGVQNRRAFTRKENEKQEKSTDLKTPGDFRQLIIQLGPSADESSDTIVSTIIRKYNKGEFTLGDIHGIAEFTPIKDTEISKMLANFVDTENVKTGFYPSNFRETEKVDKLQPRIK